MGKRAEEEGGRLRGGKGGERRGTGEQEEEKEEESMNWYDEVLAVDVAIGRQTGCEGCWEPLHYWHSFGKCRRCCQCAGQAGEREVVNAESWTCTDRRHL